MKKRAQQNIVDFKAEQINKMVSDSLTALNAQMQQTTKQMTDAVSAQMQQIVSNLQENVKQTLSEIKGQQQTLSPDQIAQKLSASTDAPAFWRKNLDYAADTSYDKAERTTKLRDKVQSFANNLGSWNLKYYDFPDVNAWVEENMQEFPYGQDVVGEYLQAVMQKRSGSYWGVQISEYEYEKQKEVSKRVKGIFKDLAGDEISGRF